MPATTEQLIYPVWGKQAEFMDAKEPIRAFCAGVGAGKSKVGALDLLQRAIPDRLYCVTGPTYTSMRDSTFRSFKEVAMQLGRLNPSQGIGKIMRGDQFSAIFKVEPSRGNGYAEVLFRSADNPDMLRGPNLSGAWMDEASLCEYEAYQVLLQRLREAGESGWISTTFTPKGLSHWTYRVFGRPRPGHKMVQARTDENPFISEDFVTQVAEEHSGLRARQELGGEFVSIEGAEWPAEYFDWDGFWFTEWPDPKDALFTVLALDPSKGRGDRVATGSRESDFSAFVWACLTKDAKLYIDADMDNKRDISMIVQDGITLCERLSPTAFLVEANSFQSMMAEEFVRISKAKNLMQAVYGITNYEPKPVRIRTLGPHLARRELRFKEGSHGATTLVQQLRDWPVAPGRFDDGPDCLASNITMLRWLLGNKAHGAQPRIIAGSMYH